MSRRLLHITAILSFTLSLFTPIVGHAQETKEDTAENEPPVPVTAPVIVPCTTPWYWTGPVELCRAGVRNALSWHLEGQIGGGVLLDKTGTWIGRGDVGLLWLAEPWLLTFAGVISYQPEGGAAYGGSLAIQHTDVGVYGGLAVQYTSDAQTLLSADIGYQLFAFGYQHWFSDAQDIDAFVFKVRIPVGIISLLL